ncbi:hypothetical protein RFF05_06950 [Bengtsoniella intestinalis]|uniref:hypothetical protein n=1 Tax=Bengtsoniella intestinalis TaxID=3073143 RepID=UPI00391FAF72
MAEGEIMPIPWIVFRLGDKELASCTMKGSFMGEVQATAELLASEHGVDTSEILVTIEARPLHQKPETE